MITAEQVDRMERMRDLGMSLGAIAETFDLNRSHVGRLLRGDIGPHSLSMRRNSKKAEPPKPVVQEPVSPVEQRLASRLIRRGATITEIASRTRLSYREIDALKSAERAQ